MFAMPPSLGTRVRRRTPSRNRPQAPRERVLPDVRFPRVAVGGALYSRPMSSSFAYLLRTTSPIGRLELTSDGTAVTSLSIERAGHLPLDEHPERSTPVLDDAAAQLGEYFAGDRRIVRRPGPPAGHPLPPGGLGAARVARVRHVRLVRRARRVARARAATAGRSAARSARTRSRSSSAATACSSSSGRITGYSGGDGIPTKLWLLEHEGITAGGMSATTDPDVRSRGRARPPSSSATTGWRAAPGRRATPSTAATTTRSGARRCTIRERSTRSCASRASRRGSRGSPSCAGARRSARCSTASSRSASRR